MRIIDPRALESFQASRELSRMAVDALHKRKRQFRAARNNAGPNIYRLHVNGKPTEELKEMLSTQATAESKGMRDHFIKHVNECLDAGIPTSEHLQIWRMDTHFLDRLDLKKRGD